MGTPWPENQCVHRKRKIEKLIKDEARDTAAQLQIPSEKPTGDHDGLEKLLEKRFSSFTESLSHLSLCRCKDCECEVTQIPKRVRRRYPISDQRSVDPGEGKRLAPVSGSVARTSVPSKTISDSGSHSGRISSETISTQNTTSSSSSAASGREESGGFVESYDSFKLACGRRRLNRRGLVSSQGSFEIENRQISFSKFWNLTRIPGEIGLLKSLTHLDISKCYYLDHLPKEISNLLQLEVLKGFVVGNSMEKEKDSCTLEHLAKLTRLRELSIDNIRREDFPVISELRDLNRLKRLHKLKIEWGGVSVHKSENITKVDNSSEEMPAVLSDLFVALSLRPVENDASPELPPQLEELHLKCLPRKSAPDWLRASKRNKIKNLHIEGGPLSDLGQLALQEKSEWQVEILRLKFLKGLEMNWTDLRKLFPKLIYFEKVGCPKLQFAPCDEQGVWMKKPNKFF